MISNCGLKNISTVINICILNGIPMPAVFSISAYVIRWAAKKYPYGKEKAIRMNRDECKSKKFETVRRDLLSENQYPFFVEKYTNRQLFAQYFFVWRVFM
jgi:hypothetical protein